MSVIVPCFEAPEALALTLAGLERQRFPRDLFEVVVVDDGSQPPIEVPGATPPAVRVVRRKRRGFGLAPARNAGVRAVAHDILVFPDNDLYGPEHLWDLVLAHDCAGTALAGKFPTTVNPASLGRTARQRAVPAETRSRSITGDDPVEVRMSRRGGKRRPAAEPHARAVRPGGRGPGGASGERLERTLRVALFGALGLLLLTPLVVTPSTVAPYTLGKALRARSLIEIAFALWAVLAVLRPGYRPPRSWGTAADGDRPRRGAARRTDRFESAAQPLVDQQPHGRRGGTGPPVRARAPADRHAAPPGRVARAALGPISSPAQPSRA